MSKSAQRIITFICGMIISGFGFKYGTQSGLEGSSGWVQNDGYAVTGCVLCVAGGIVMGIALYAEWNGRAKRS